ncbi:MAG: hypothetical protein WCC26_00365 [Terracidiphilus sp.]
MDIAPIGGIRIFSPGTPLKADNTAPRFEIGASTRTGEEKYSASRQTPDRGLEEADSESQAAEPDAQADEALAAPEDATSGTTINIVA